MKKNELRIGNYIYSYSEIYKVEMIDGYGFNRKEDEDPAPGHKTYQGDLPYMRGIPLTEKILVKSGFEKGLNPFVGGEIYFSSPKHEIAMQFGIGNNLLIGPVRQPTNVSIKYVHQLQNLYYALTGKELKIRL